MCMKDLFSRHWMIDRQLQMRLPILREKTVRGYVEKWSAVLEETLPRSKTEIGA